MAGSRRHRSVNTRRRENTRGRNTSLSTIKKREEEKKVTNNARNLTTNTQRRNNNNQKRTTIGNPRRQTSAQQNVQQKKKDTTNRLAQLTKGNLQTIVGSHETTFNAIRNPMEQQYTAAQKLREQRGEKPSATMGAYEQLLNRERTGMKETREANLEKAAKKIKKGEKNIEKSTEELGSVGKFAADLYGAGLGMAADALAGPAATASLLSRSFGSAYNRAKEEGADDSQAALYGAAVGGLEAGSERLFAVATPLRKLYGAGAGDELTEKVLQKLVSKAGKEGAKTAIYNGGKVFGSALTEALEEMVVEGLEPAVANQIYAEAVGMPHETSAKDVLYAGLLGGVMGGVLGGAGQIVDHRQGKRVQEVFGEDGVLDLAKKAADSDESIGKSLTGAALAEMINNGEAVVAGQANDLYKTVQRQQQKDEQRNQDSRAAADNIIQQNNYVEPSVIDPQTGEELLRRNTANKLEEVKAEAIDMSADMQLPDMTTNQIAESVARIMTGIARPTDVNLFAKSNPAAREVYARMTGKELPDSNEGTRDYLWNQIAQNRVATAEAETLDVADRTKGIIEQRMGDTYEASGQALFAQELAGINPNDTASLEATVVSFDDFYRAGRRNLPMDDVMAMGNPFHARVPEPLRKAAYNAGREDRFIASDTAKGLQLKRGQTAKENRSMGRKTGSKGKLMTDALSEEMRQELPATQMALLRTLARTFNINIHVVDTLAQQEGEASPNGFYVDGEVYLSMTGDRPLPYIFAHEITHHMQVYAPKEYNQLKELVRRRWGDQGGMDAAIDAKRAHYAQRNVSLSYEDALDEIIADSTYEILQDEGFVDELCRSHRNIAQALLDAIKNVISKIRATLAEGELFTPAQNANLLSELDILKDFERVWANGLMRAAENRDAVGTVSETENVVKLSAKEYSNVDLSKQQKYYEAQINKWNGEDNGGYFKVGMPSKPLLDVGVQDEMIYFDESKASNVLKKHKDHMTKNELKLVPKILNNPIVIAGSYNNSIIIFGEEMVKGKPIMVALKLEARRRGTYVREVTKVSTTEVRSDMEKLLEERKVLWLSEDKKKTSSWFQASGLTMPFGGTKFGLIKRIQDFNKNSNTYKENSGINYSLPDTDENPTRDPRMKFSLADTVEETKNLIAVHNIFEHKLMSAFELGGFPMPSIAVTKDNVSHDGFGPISVLFDKSTIDPKTSRYNKVFSGDAYTPTFPSVSIMIDEKVADGIKDKLTNILDGTNFMQMSDVDFYQENMGRNLERFGTPAEAYGSEATFKIAYIKDKGLNIDIPHTEKVSQWGNPTIKAVSDALGKKIPMKYAGVEDTMKLEPEIRELVNKTFMEQHGVENFLTEEMGFAQVNEILDDVRNYRRKGFETRIDKRELDNVFEEKVDANEYEKWINNLFEGIVKKKGIRNNKDLFTPSGNRRSWESLHNDVTLDNIIKIMRADEMQKGGAMFGGSLTGASAQEYSSIQEIKANTNKLGKLTEEELKANKDYIVDTLNDIALRYAKGKDWWDARNTLVEAVAKYETKRGITSYLKQYDYVYKSDESIVDDIIALRDYIRNLPTPYFEAKPRRAVTFDEVKAVIIPDEIGEELIAALDENGIEYVTYDGTETDRLVKINEVAEEKGIKFSLPDEEAVYDYINSNETEFVEVPPVKDYERAARNVQTKSVEELQKQVEILKRDKRLTHGKELDKASIKTEMTELIKVLMSHSEGARGVYDRKLVNLGMENANIIYRAFKDGDMASVTNTAYYAAKEIVENLKFIDDTAFIHYKELRDIMKDTAVTISEADKADIPDYSEFYKSTFGRLKIVNEGGMPVDDLYATLAEAYPDLFDPELTHPADQLMAMADVREALEPYDVMLSAEETEQLIKETAHDLIEVSLRGKPWKSWADRQKEVYDNKLKTMKAMHKEALNDLRIKERMRATRMVDKEKLKAKEYKEKQKDGKARAKANGSIMKNYKWLADRLAKPTDDKHIPDGFRKSLADMLQAFELQSARSKALEEKYGAPSQKTIKMRELRDRLSEIAKEDDTGVFQYDGYVIDLMNALAEKLEGKTISEASTEDLASIDTLLKAIVTNIRNYNKAFSDDIKATISELAEKTIEADNERIAKRGKKADRSGIIGGADSMLNESMVSPRDFFEQIGGGVEEAFLSMRKGFDKHVDNLTKTRAFFGEIFPKYNKKTWLRKRAKPGSIIEHWRDTTFQEEFQLESGDTIKLNPAQMMSLYCLMKREQAQGHIFGSGIVASRVDSKSRLWQSLGAKIQPQGSAVMITPTDAENIISKLTPEQIELADELQAYLNNECAEWGNEVSLKLYGYSKFTEENYFPIKSADQYLDSNFESRQTAERIKNFGFTKGTVTSANNPIMIDDIFRVVADHINKMSLYNAFAAPISDFTRVYNYKSRDDSGVITGSVKASLEDAHGKKALNYINNFMADLNNQAQTRTEGFGRFLNKSLANYKKAMIGGNFRVALQQPTAVVRAFMLMSPKYFVNAHVNPVKNLRDMKEHCQIARWKSWGHNQVDMARDIDEIMMNNEWTRIDALTMKMYGGLDNLTWSTIWAAIRKETAALHPEVKVNSEEFYAICNDRASEVFDKTQVVDSVFHRSEIMRNKDTMSKMVTSFMAEPTRTFNMVRTELVKAREMWNDGDKGKAVAHANRTLSVFMINAAMVSAAAAIADALRDKDPDDDGEDEGFIPTWLENFWANFWGNVNPINMIPVANDVWGVTEGWSITNMALDGWADLVKSAMALADPEKRDWRKFAESIATVFGIPLKNSLRELEIFFGWAGIDVFAAEAGEEEEEAKQPLKVKIGSKFDNFLNSIGVDRSEAEKYERSFDKRVKQYERSTKNMTDADKQEYLWKQITADYTTYIKDGNFAAVKDMRAMLKATGGDYEKFDKSVLDKTKAAMKKSIGTDEATLNACRNFLIDNYGYTEGKISAEILSDSETATDFQLALCTNDFDSAVDALRTLYDAGMTEADAYTLFMNRSKAIKAKDFSTGEFVSPVDGEISSGFGYRDAPTAGASTYHEAIDIAAPAGSPVVAADGGKVTKVGYNGGYGYSVTIDHGNGKYTIYNHLQDYSVLKGDAVTKGQEIARVGSTGISTGPHLDFQVRVNGTYVDPTYFL